MNRLMNIVAKVCGYEDGIKYLILNMVYDDVDKDAMIKMAKDVINK